MSALTVKTPEAAAALRDRYYLSNGDLNHPAIDAAMANAKKIEIFAHHMRFDNVILLDGAFKFNASMMPKDYKDCIVIGENHEKFEACRAVLLEASKKIKALEQKAEAARKVKEAGLKQMAAATAKLAASTDEKKKINAELDDLDAEEQELLKEMARLELLKKQKAAAGAAGNHKAVSPKQAASVSAAGQHKQQSVSANTKSGSPPKPPATVQSIPAAAAGKPVVPAKPALPASGPHKVASN